MHEKFKSFFGILSADRFRLSSSLVKGFRTPVGHTHAILTPISTYIKWLGIAWLVVGVAFTVQVVFFYRRFEPSFLLMPMTVATVIGILLGRVCLLGDRLKQKTELFRTVADLAQEFIYFRRTDGSYEYVSPACLALTGYAADEFRDSPGLFDRLVHPEDQKNWQNHLRHVCGTGLRESLDIRLRAKNGRKVWISHICGPVYDSKGGQIGTRSTNLDITQRKVFEERKEKMAYYDPLTNLPNRRALNRELRKLIKSSHESDQCFSVLFLDLDRFKLINDTFGHAIGDRLLRRVGKRLTQCCNEDNIVTRFGGDEFVIVTPRISRAAIEVEDYAREILENIERPFKVDDMELYLSGHIGVASFPNDGEDAGELIRNADVAMYKSKKDPHGSIRFYSSEMPYDTAAFVNIENSLRKALQTGGFELHYQPIVDIASCGILGLEALVRWRRAGEGFLPPNEFIPVAEETGLIKPLGEQLLRKVCADLAGWQAEGIALPVSLNVSGIQFMDSRFCGTVEEIVGEAEFDASLLTLEVTEHIFLGDMDHVVEKLNRLRRFGLSIALDDFGTGYSSLNYLKDLPINTVKIDGIFIRDIAGNSRDLALLRAILSFCRELNLKSVVEGVETEEQKQVLLSLGWKVAQGFLFHKPLPVKEIDRLLAESSGHSSLSDV